MTKKDIIELIQPQHLELKKGGCQTEDEASDEEAEPIVIEFVETASEDPTLVELQSRVSAEVSLP